MLFEKNESNFIVQEILDLKLEKNNNGKYKYYILEKSGIDSSNAIKLIGKQNKTAIYYSGLKDAKSTSIQWICSKKYLAEPNDERINLEYVGASNKRIFVGMHTANKFIIKLSKISEKEKTLIPKILKHETFPNYFDEQRFHGKSIKAGELLVNENYEAAAKEILTNHDCFETEKSKNIKEYIKNNWGNWKKILKNKKIPETKKIFFKELENGKNFKDCINLLERKSVSIACKASQAMQFNLKLKSLIEKQNKKEIPQIEISGKKFPIKFSHHGIKRNIIIPPIFPAKTELTRKTFFKAEQPKTTFFEENCVLEFKLRKGCYATILVKSLKALCENKIMGEEHAGNS
jgi:TruD family tRNA pseudouridine synthase